LADARQDGPRAARSRHRQHEPNRSSELLRECRALELSGAQLRLQINERAFHLDVQDLLPRLEDKVGGPSIS